jgi:hypothetical protein
VIGIIWKILETVAIFIVFFTSQQRNNGIGNLAFTYFVLLLNLLAIFLMNHQLYANRNEIKETIFKY